MPPDSRKIRRRAAVLYADICDSTTLTAGLDPEDAHELMGSCIREFEIAARRHGASLVKYRGDAVLAAYGIPEAHEGTARAAVNAALDMRASVARLDTAKRHGLTPQISIGIASGVVVAGDVSGTEDVEIDLAGDAANRAARLSDAAGRGEILVDETTRSQIACEFDYAIRGTRSLKGFDEPVAIFEIRAEEPALHRQNRASEIGFDAAFLGREDSVKALRRQVGRLLEEGRGGCTLVTGSAGIGKTRLVQQTEFLSRETSTTWLWGRSLQVGASMPYHPFRDLLLSWAGVADEVRSGDGQRLRERLASLFPSEDDDRPAALSLLAGVPLETEERERLDRYPTSLREQATHRAYRDWLAGLSKSTPLVVALDDLHWADASTLRLLESLLPMAEQLSILFLLLSREEDRDRLAELEGTVERTVDPTSSARISIAPLEPEFARSLAQQATRGRSIDPTVLGEICSRSGGNPFMLEEFVSATLERIDHAGGSGRPNWGDQIEMPRSIEEVVLARLELLPQEERTALEATAVVGSAVEPILLAAILGIGSPPGPELESLARRNLLIRQQGASGLSYAIAHPSVRQVTYESLTHRDRQRLHLDVAHVLSDAATVGDESLPGRLAYHFSAAGRVEEARARLLDAGDHAARCGASDEAIMFFQRASEVLLSSDALGPSSEDAARIERQLSSAHFNRGRLEDSERHFERYLRIRGESVPKGRLGSLARTAANLVTIAREVYLPANDERRPRATPVDQEVIDVMFNRARTETQASVGNFVGHSLETLAKLRRFDAASVRGAGGMMAAAIGIFTFAGIMPRASSYFLRVGEEAVDEADGADQMLLRSMQFFHGHFIGNWDDALHVRSSLFDDAERAGNLWEVVTYLAILSKQLVHQGRFEELAPLCARLRGIEEAYEYPLARENLNAVATLLAAERGRFEEALGHSELHLMTATGVGAQVFALGLQAKILIELDELESAREVLEEARDRSRSVASVLPFQESALNRSEAMFAARLAHEGVNVRLGPLRRRLWMRTASRNVAERVQIARHLCDYSIAQGRLHRARRYWSLGNELADRLGMRPEQKRFVALAERSPELGIALDGGSSH